MKIRLLSVVIPFYNEEDNVAAVLRELYAVLKTLDFPVEILAINDGSKDGTWDELAKLKLEMPELKAIRLRSNFGQTKAMATGIRLASGDWILTMDGDGQNDPSSIPKLVARAREGYDVVSGWRKDRQDSKVMRTIPSRIANSLLASITGLSLHDSGCSLKLYRAHAIRSISLYADRHRFIPFLIHIRGFRVIEEVVGHRPRFRGKTKYGYMRTVRVLLDLIAFTLFAKFREMPRFYYFMASLPFFAGFALFMILAAVQQAGISGSRGTVTFFGAAFLSAYGALFLIGCGLLAEWMTHFNHGRRQHVVN